ncbi:MAG: 4-(cytidine 5'-diphospho)-2-C-methyl-D-erythritol kinase [Pseudomonadota bacterium]
MITEIAPAKINLYLHVGAQRRDKLHDLESVFVFADGGDVLTAEAAGTLTLELTGPFATALRNEPVEKNLVMRAARLLKETFEVRAGARLVLDKRLPIASGIGGGSADAAAALRALVRLWGLRVTGPELRRLAFSLGADVPACLDRAPTHVGGAGEVLSRGPLLPPLWVCLVNPQVPMPTGPVFRDFDAASPRPSAPLKVSLAGNGYRAVRRLLDNTCNDLEAFAIHRQSVVQTVIGRLASRPGALGARMSGSGATVFGLFTSAVAAARAGRDMAGRGWWSMSAPLCAPDRSRSGWCSR